MRALVTGSTGFIGGAICKALVEKSFTVRAFHRESSNLTLIKDLPVEHAIGDLTQPQSINNAMENVDVVFHVAAMLGSSSQPGRMYTVTVEGTRSIIDAALEHGIKKLVHTSSVAALGIPQSPCEQTAPDETAQMDENHTWNYRSDQWPYGYSKYLAELEVQKGVAQGLDAVIINPSYVVGAGDIYRKTSSPIIQIAQKRYPFIPAGGLNIVHIDDVVTCHLNSLEYGSPGERYIIAGDNLTLMDFIQKVATIANVSAPRWLIPGKLLRTVAPMVQWLNPLLDISVPVELLRLAGYGFYYTANKSKTTLHLPDLKSSEKAIQDAFDWFKKIGAI
jgi:dihydroflavonol-4-reductase